jgi:hypothetical protein
MAPRINWPPTSIPPGNAIELKPIHGAHSYNEIHPIQPRGTVIVGHKSTIVSAFPFGNANLYADSNGTLLSPFEWTPTQMDTIYDKASLTNTLLVESIQRIQLKIWCFEDRGSISIKIK